MIIYFKEGNILINIAKGSSLSLTNACDSYVSSVKKHMAGNGSNCYRCLHTAISLLTGMRALVHI